MKRKNLLNETQVRKFMKLANINKDVANNFLAEGLETQGGNKDRTAVKTDANIVPKGSRWLKEQEDDGGEEVLDDLPGDEAPMGDMDDMGDMGDEAGISLSDSDALRLVDAIVDAIGTETGIEFETSMGGGEEGGEVPPEDDFAPPGDEGEDLDADLEVMDEDEIVTETLRRVTYRLNAVNERQKVINEAMRRIQVRYGRRTR